VLEGGGCVSVKQRLRPTPAQVEVFALHAGHARFVFNLGLEQRSMWRPDHRGRRPAITAASQQRELAQARSQVDWLRAGSSVVQQGALRDLDRAFVNFFAGRAAYPRYRKRGGRASFAVRDVRLKRTGRRSAMVLIPKAGWVRLRLSVPWEQAATATSARVVSDPAGRWHIALTTPPRPFQRQATGKTVGLDRGVANTLATSDGAMMHAPTLTGGEQARFLALQRRLSRQVKGSNRYRATRTALGRLRGRLDDRRTDWVEQTSTTLVRRHDLIVLEALRTRNMTRRPAPRPDPDTPGVFLPNGARAKAALNRAILAQCWGKLATRITDKAATTPEHATTLVVLVDPTNTSRRCAACGHTAPGNRESQAVFVCQSCGHHAHADTNAAVNILHRGTTAATQPPDRRGSDASAPHHVGRVNHLATT